MLGVRNLSKSKWEAPRSESNFTRRPLFVLLHEASNYEFNIASSSTREIRVEVGLTSMLQVNIFHLTTQAGWVGYYFICGYKGFHEYAKLGGLEVGSPVGLDVMVDGTVPTRSGLSSSMAFVCSSTRPIMAAQGVNLSKMEMDPHLAKTGMEHSASHHTRNILMLTQNDVVNRLTSSLYPTGEFLRKIETNPDLLSHVVQQVAN
ncbi:hypothetical protein L1987_06175 [Smallanthus sonchifolius]|uniref:Uncharacterized protein n=1 Tax=Smallanthus sonchifolius TaxID=185202 RepID=A0ACB9JXE5_9ASTR|nr:hypothetical protein L1987_06175 [Smallanthus sonchifolius]